MTQRVGGSLSARVKSQLAACQFELTGDIERNRKAVMWQMHAAKRQGATFVQSSEGCLSGYSGAELKRGAELDWAALDAAMRDIMTLGLPFQRQAQASEQPLCRR